MKSQVSIVRGPKKPNRSDIAAGVRQAIELVGGLDSIKKGDVVLIKPDIRSVAKPGSEVYTDPEACRAIADMVQKKRAGGNQGGIRGTRQYGPIVTGKTKSIPEVDQTVG